MREKETCRRWLRYSVEDAKAAQAALDEMAAAGWELEEIGLLSGTFRRAEEPRPCWVEPARWGSIRRRDEEQKAEYLELCAQAGWELLDETGGLWYFRARPGERPAPIQTDELVEWEMVWRRVLKDRIFNLCYLSLYWSIYWVINFVLRKYYIWQFLLSNSTMAMLGVILLWTLLNLMQAGHVLRYRARCRRAAEAGEPFPVPGRRGAFVRGNAWLSTLLVAVAVLLSLLGMTGEEKRSGELGGLMCYDTASVLLSHTEYRRFGEEDWLYLDDYDCRFSWLAEVVCNDLVSDESQEKKRDTHFHPVVTPEPAELGFDQAWTYPAGERAGLILRQGNRVIRVEAVGADFTDGNTLQALWEGLQLGG